MPLTFGSVASLAAKFDRPVARINPNDTMATLNRIVERKVNPSAVANASRGASIRKIFAASRPLPDPAFHSVSAHGGGKNLATTRSMTEMPVASHPSTVAKHRDYFERLVFESKKEPTLLGRAAIPKRLGTGIHQGAVVWEPIARDNARHVERVRSCDEVIDRPQAASPAKATRTPRPIVNHLANIVRNRKADLQAREASVAPLGENIGRPARFSMAHIASPPMPSGLPDEHAHSDYESYSSGSSAGSSPPGSPNALNPVMRWSEGRAEAISQSELLPPDEDLTIVNEKNELDRYFINLVSPASNKEKTHVDDDPSLGEMHSDYGSDVSGSSSPSSPPGSPDARGPVSPWRQAYAEALSQPPFTPPDEEVTWTRIKGAIGQLNMAIDDESKYAVSDDAVDLLQLAESHITNRDMWAAHAAIMRALDGVTEIQAAFESSHSQARFDDAGSSDDSGVEDRSGIDPPKSNVVVDGEATLRSLSPVLTEPPAFPSRVELTDDEWATDLEECLASLDMIATRKFRAHKDRLETLDALLESFGLTMSGDMPANYAESAQGRGAKKLLAEAREMTARMPPRTVYMFLEQAMLDLSHLPNTPQLREHSEARVREPRRLSSEGFWT